MNQRAVAQELDKQHQLDQTRALPTDEPDAPENRVDDGNKGQNEDSSRRRGKAESEDGASTEEAIPPGGGKSDRSEIIDIVA